MSGSQGDLPAPEYRQSCGLRCVSGHNPVRPPRPPQEITVKTNHDLAMLVR
jgi:hypothetical protein